jgi:hypothetical protein
LISSYVVKWDKLILIEVVAIFSDLVTAKTVFSGFLSFDEQAEPVEIYISFCSNIW